ncbi:MAG: ATP-binding protein [Salinivirgaceae bacterium]|nr:ATP-binding protein [Salinivirgaceae bacterium]
MQINPFIISGYVSERYFCGREKETQELIQEITDGNNVAIIATRRMGKSDLIRHVFNQSEICASYYTFYVDIYATRTLREFVYLLSKEIVDELKPQGQKSISRFWNYIKSIQAGVSFGPAGEPSFNLQLGDLQQPETTLDEIFKYLQTADKPCIVAIDEFQQTALYPEKNIEAILRTYTQKCSNAKFIFAGSQRHMMGQMFTSASRPFYQSVSIMNIGPIDIDKYKIFAVHHFEDVGKKLDTETVDKVFAVCHNITWYVQKMFSILYSRTSSGETCRPDMVMPTLAYILSTLDYTYKETLFRMPKKQKEVFVAIAKEGEAKNITSGSFVKKYKLPSPSTVQAAVKGLLENDYLTHELGVHTVYDLFLGYWIQRNY